MKNDHAILLPQQLPQEVLAFLDEYIYQIDGQTYLLSRSFEAEGYFVALEVLKNDKSKKTWRVKLPLQYVLAVAQLRDQDGSKIGFLSKP